MGQQAALLAATSQPTYISPVTGIVARADLLAATSQPTYISPVTGKVARADLLAATSQPTYTVYHQSQVVAGLLHFISQLTSQLSKLLHQA